MIICLIWCHPSCRKAIVALCHCVLKQKIQLRVNLICRRGSSSLESSFNVSVLWKYAVRKNTQICVSCVELYLEDTGDKPKRGKPETCWDPLGWQSREPAGAAELAREGAGGGGNSRGGTAKGCAASGVCAAGLHVKSSSGLGVCAEELTQRPKTGVPRKPASKVGPRLASGSLDLGRVPPTPHEWQAAPCPKPCVQTAGPVLGACCPPASLGWGWVSGRGCSWDWPPSKNPGRWLWCVPAGQHCARAPSARFWGSWACPVRLYWRERWRLVPRTSPPTSRPLGWPCSASSCCNRSAVMTAPCWVPTSSQWITDPRRVLGDPQLVQEHRDYGYASCSFPAVPLRSCNELTLPT